jgi:hypothetical protein
VTPGWFTPKPNNDLGLPGDKPTAKQCKFFGCFNIFAAIPV